MKTLLKKLQKSESISLNDFSNKSDLIHMLKKEFIESESMNNLLISDDKLRKNLLSLLSQVYYYYYLKTLNDKRDLSSGVQMKQIFGSKSLKFFTALRQLSDENYIYR